MKPNLKNKCPEKHYFKGFFFQLYKEKKGGGIRMNKIDKPLRTENNSPMNYSLKHKNHLPEPSLSEWN